MHRLINLIFKLNYFLDSHKTLNPKLTKWLQFGGHAKPNPRSQLARGRLGFIVEHHRTGDSASLAKLVLVLVMEYYGVTVTWMFLARLYKKRTKYSQLADFTAC